MPSGAAVAQVKAEVRPIGRPIVQQLFGIAAHQGKEALVFSLGGFTDGAITWANEAGVALFEFDLSGLPQPLNLVANPLVATRSDRPSGDPTRWLCDTTEDLDQAVSSLKSARTGGLVPNLMVVGERRLAEEVGKGILHGSQMDLKLWT